MSVNVTRSTLIHRFCIFLRIMHAVHSRSSGFRAEAQEFNRICLIFKIKKFTSTLRRILSLDNFQQLN